MSDCRPYRSVIVLGDSHARYMKRAADLGLFGNRTVHVSAISGATAAGLRNPNSFTEASKFFRATLKNKEKNAFVVFHLGEIDCGLLIWMRARDKGITLDSSIELSISSYMNFVDEIKNLGFMNIIITSATLPTITDDDQLGAVVNERRSKIAATQACRTAATHKFNDILKKESLKYGFPFVEITEYAINQETGLVHTWLRNSDPSDHHMEMSLAAVPWAIELTAIFEKSDPEPTTSERFIAIVDTELRSSPLDEKAFPSIEVQRTPKGTEIVASRIELPGKFSILRQATLDGVPIRKPLHYVETDAWQPVLR